MKRTAFLVVLTTHVTSLPGCVLVVKKDILENIVISLVMHVSMTSANRNPVNV